MVLQCFHQANGSLILPKAREVNGALGLSRALENSNTVRLSVTGAGPLNVVYVVTRD